VGLLDRGRRLDTVRGGLLIPARRAGTIALDSKLGETQFHATDPMGNLKKKRRLKMNKHKRRKRLKSNRHKKRTWQK
jgi:Mitochondrial domain of unknown function (DUF1713)